MKDREKQIEEMATDIQPLIASQINLAKCTYVLQENQDKYNGMCWEADFKKISELLYNAGYRKMDEVTLRIDLGDRTPEEIKLIAEMFNGEIKKQVVKEILQTILDLHKDENGSHKETANPQTEPEYFGMGIWREYLRRHIRVLAKEYGVEVDE